jgi:hypothetical protein
LPMANGEPSFQFFHSARRPQTKPAQLRYNARWGSLW